MTGGRLKRRENNPKSEFLEHEIVCKQQIHKETRKPGFCFLVSWFPYFKFHTSAEKPCPPDGRSAGRATCRAQQTTPFAPRAGASRDVFARRRAAGRANKRGCAPASSETPR